MTPQATSHDQVRTKVIELIRHKLFHPSKDNNQILALSDEVRDLWPTWIQSGDLEGCVNRWLRNLGLSHTGFWRGVGAGMPPYFAINATLKRIGNGALAFWDVLPGGLAERAGIDAGDVLIGINGNAISGDGPRFQFGKSYDLSVTRDGVERAVRITLPAHGPKDRPPMTEAAPLTFSAESRLATLKITSFPGAVGFSMLGDLKNAIASIRERKCDRLIVDLRANCGGGLSSVRLMSLLVPDRRLIGYSLTRRGRDEKAIERLPAIRKLPANKLGLLPLALRFKFVNRDRSFKLFTEGLGRMPFHGRMALLVDEYTRSAAEMVAAFARNEHVAHIVGTRTPGEVLGAANFHVGLDYRLRMPVTAWYTAHDELVEGKGVAPMMQVSNTLESLRAKRDLPMEAAVAQLNI
jgi:C-terminal processing protease CtpA/Prc